LAASPSTLSSVFASAKAGDSVVLSAGSYGSFKGGSKSGLVTVKAAPGASVSMSIAFNPAVNVRVQGVTVTGLDIGGASHDVTVADSTFTGMALIRANQMVNANVVLDHNTHANQNVCSGCFEGRVDITGQGSGPSGVVIKNSTFGPGGNADGIQTGGYGVQILNNEFTGIYESAGIHTDAIQLYGQKQTVIRGNWIHGTSSGIMAPDGGNQELIENNVIDPGSYPYAITLGADKGSIIRHNTLPDGACAWNLRCGIINLTSKDSANPSTGTIVTDNVLGELALSNGSSGAGQDYNLLQNGALRGLHDLRGTPTYTGGAKPTTYAGYALKPGSPGTTNATDGTNRGINPTTSTDPNPTPTPTP
ncbi:right-handed parallel beta-helix repeat-containing protein, partial [Solirubrobacter ginsenosidimutans]